MNSMLNTIKAECIRLKNDYRYYWFNYLLTYVNFLILLSGLFFVSVLRSNDSSPFRLYEFLFGIMIWYLGYSVVSSFSQILTEEILLGTMNQIIVSGTKIHRVLIARQITHLFVTAIFLTIFLTIAMVYSGVSSDISELQRVATATLLLFSITVVGLFGIAFGVASLAFKYKKVSALANIVNYIFLFFTGSIINLELLPAWLKNFLFVIPLTWANIIFRRAMEGQTVLAESIALASISVTYLFLGILMYWYMYNRKRRGF